ncbi:MAG: DUF6242 domain-containing protein [Bacteroidaceae bacterium]|nr:DUF6242 domain-containing protein [Bacteroidaceae bacterium]
MRKISGIIACFFAFSMLVSCLPTTKQTLLPIAVIESFTIGGFQYEKNDINNYGRDTMVIESGTGSNYHFFIDQKQGLIYNPDSLPFATVVSGLKTSLRAQGTVSFENRRQNSDVYPYINWSADDTIDFTRPVRFRVISPDKSYTRYYTVSLNVHTQNPDSMQWRTISAPQLVGVQSIKAVQHGDSLYVLYNRTDDGSNGMMRIGLDSNCTDLAVNGIPQGKTVRSLVSFHGKLFALSDSTLYESQDGADWSVCNTNITLTRLANVYCRSQADTLLWGFTAEGAVCSSNGTDWTHVPEISQPFTNSDVSYLSYNLQTNKNLYRCLIAGISPATGECEIFTRISNSGRWQKVMPSPHSELGLPALSGLSVIRYDESLFAFGGSSYDSSVPAYKGFFQSLDNGISWLYCDRYCLEYNTWNNFMQLPAGLQQLQPLGHAVVVDGTDTIWIFPTDGGVYYKGYINRLKY